MTARGDSMARFRVASTATRYDRSSGRWVDGDTTYWNVTVWRRAADSARDSLAKGHPVVVHGRVRQRTVDREVPGAPGVTVPVTFTDVEAKHFGLDLTRCQATYRRAPVGPQTAEGMGAGARTDSPTTGPASADGTGAGGVEPGHAGAGAAGSARLDRAADAPPGAAGKAPAGRPEAQDGAAA